MFWSIVRFELRYHLRNPLLYIIGSLMLTLAFGAVSSDSVQVGGAIGQVHRNAPTVLINLLAFMTPIGLLIVTAFVATSILRDWDLGTHELFFSRPVGKTRLLLARFTGSMAASLLLYIGPIAGMMAANFWLMNDPERIGPFTLAPYLWAAAFVILPNLIFMGGVFFAVAVVTRSLFGTYLAVVGTLMAFGISRVLLRDLPSHAIGAMMDPFGMAALKVQTRYWTIIEKNSMMPEIDGLLLANRLLWVLVGLGVLAVGIWWFDPARGRKAGRLEAADGAEPGLGALQPSADLRRTRAPKLGFGLADRLKMLVQQTRFETVAILRGAPFIVILAFAVFNVAGEAFFREMIQGTAPIPVTRIKLDAIGGTYLFILVLVVSFYAGESIWRDRSVKLAEVRDALPAPTWVYMISKMIALLAVMVIFAGIGAATTIASQLAAGYTRLEPGLYAGGLVLMTIPYVFCAVLAVFALVLARSKFLGYLAVLLYLFLDDIYDALNMDHNLYRFPFLPDLEYSDMNGWGHYLEPYLWYTLYWAFLCVVLLAVSALFWVRGSETGWRFRRRLARQRFTAPARAAVAVGVIGFLATGAFIFYNTNILNTYEPDDVADRMRADYEQKYRPYLDDPHPRITDVTAEVDIYPEERRVSIRGTYRMRNTTDGEIADLHISMPRRIVIKNIDLPPHAVTLDDRRLGYRIVRLADPMAPGATLEMDFELEIVNPGFVNNDPNDQVVANGTLFTSRHVMPTIGYREWIELEDRNKRRKYGLEPHRRLAAIDDVDAYRNNELGPDADLVSFRATVSTTPDQIAVAPGYLEREWVEDGRRHFAYAMDTPIRNLYCFLSADYEVKRDRWNDIDIEVFYHAPHDFNVDRMIHAVKRSLDYYTANFGPYQFRQVRILEFPRYETFAMSLPNTIPYSEAIGFIADIDDDDGIDTVMYVTAHEVAHQWWAHQVLGAGVEGANMITESLSQYSSLMVMEEEYGRDMMRRFLKYELDRYLAGRGRDVLDEKPLMLVEQQPYIYYRKGSVVLYALSDYLGVDTVNRGLARYVREVAFQGPPYTTSRELVNLLRAEAPGADPRLFEDLLETITLYANRVEEASWKELEDGRYLVRMAVEARKLRSDGRGLETEVPLDDWIDVGVFGPDDEVLFLEKRRITGGSVSFEITVDGRPEKAGIDPYNKLVDRDSNDNVMRVREG